MKKMTLFARLLVSGFERVNQSVIWHRLPRRLGVFNLIVLRMKLRHSNLHDTRTPGKTRAMRLWRSTGSRTRNARCGACRAP